MLPDELDVAHHELELPAYWRAIPRLLLGAIFIVAIAIGLTFFRPQMLERATLEAKVKALTYEKDKLTAEQNYKRQKLSWLKGDPEYMEIQARDLLEFSAPNEEVVKFE